MRFLYACFVIVLCALIFCEYVADFVVLQKCKWPEIKRKKYVDDPLRAMILADPHLLGPHRGHWLDKLYREWHMTRAFQAASRLFQPDVVFVLGDLFDEGDMVSDKQFQEYVWRYLKMFHLPPGIPLISVAGNHDVGFHYKMHPFFMSRFESYLNNSSVNLYTIKQIHFVVINSMAMEGDGCMFCTQAEDQLKNISRTLHCMKYPLEAECARTRRHPYSQPILLQHFPTYRISDTMCEEHDAPYIEAFRERFHVLSKDATDMLGELLKPRLAFAGHSHHFCHSVNRLGIDEYTVASFSWRNKVNPSFMLATITPDDYVVSKCKMLPQQFVYNSYLSAGILCLIVIGFQLRKCIQRRQQSSVVDHRKVNYLD
ncbi:metallophosphoesterase 1 homolog isoform X1 [Drosophila mauritiana]|uniref:Metallophosphoesterase 1 homolog n=2 Tax=Drosophila mauritiana TaxID=7226 RepID=A0A6P8J6V4_DROMA|nr:metallophosphoesterase 1 homolog isoform X1 [Drosophila mauritiana]